MTPAHETSPKVVDVSALADVTYAASDIGAATTGCDLARQLQAGIRRARDQLLTFCDYPGEVDVTNNTSERSEVVSLGVV